MFINFISNTNKLDFKRSFPLALAWMNAILDSNLIKTEIQHLSFPETSNFIFGIERAVLYIFLIADFLQRVMSLYR